MQNINELLSAHINLPVVRGRLPKYVIVDDAKGSTADVEEMISVLYAGATLSKHQCLEEPAREELPVVDDLPPAPANPVIEEEEDAPVAPARGGWMRSLKNRISNTCSAPDDDSDIHE